jgi:tRNA nucleotidyltransferase/poly(A) polymerase
MEAVHTRKEIYNHVNRNPVTAYGTIQEDALRRDLTINAIYYNVSKGRSISPLGGTSKLDLASKIITTCDEPETTFMDDPLRAFRTLRFQAKLNKIDNEWDIDSKVTKCIKNHKYDLKILQWERINSELEQILQSGNVCNVFKLLRAVLNDEKFPPFISKGIIETDYIEFKRAFKKGTIGDFYSILLFNYENAYGFEFDVDKQLRSMKLPNSEIKKAVDMHDTFANLRIMHRLECKDRDFILFLRRIALRLRDKELLKKALLYYNIFELKVFDKLDKNYLKLTDDILFYINYKLPFDGKYIMDKLRITQGVKIGEIIKYCEKKVTEYPFLHDKPDTLLKLANKHCF